jgi:hypothetical protein
MNGHLLRCQSALRAHVRTSTLRAQGNANGDFPTGAPCIWRIPEQAPTLQYSGTLLEGGR